METKVNQGGRPLKNAVDKRDRLVRIRFSSFEYNRLVERKITTQTRDLSAFIRAICLDKPIRMKPVLTTHQDQILSITREMRTDILRIGVNINQSAKRINSTTDYYDLQREVNALTANIDKIDADLHRLIGLISSGGTSQETISHLADGRSH